MAFHSNPSLAVAFGSTHIRVLLAAYTRTVLPGEQLSDGLTVSGVGATVVIGTGAACWAGAAGPLLLPLPLDAPPLLLPAPPLLVLPLLAGDATGLGGGACCLGDGGGGVMGLTGGGFGGRLFFGASASGGLGVSVVVLVSSCFGAGAGGLLQTGSCPAAVVAVLGACWVLPGSCRELAAAACQETITNSTSKNVACVSFIMQLYWTQFRGLGRAGSPLSWCLMMGDGSSGEWSNEARIR